MQNTSQNQNIDWKKGMSGTPGSSVKTHKLEVLNTKPPEYYNEGTLIIAMKNVDKTIKDPELKKLLKGADGIGTPATRASIIDNLSSRLWVETQKDGMHVTERGITLSSQIPEESGFRDVVTSAYWEMNLKAIEHSGNDQDFDKFCSEMEKSTYNLVKLFQKQPSFQLPGEASKLEQDGKTCDKCNSGVYKSLNSKGRAFLKCQNDACNSTVFPPEIWGDKSKSAAKPSAAKKFFNKAKK